MGNQLNVIVADDDTIFIDGQMLLDQAELVATLRSAAQADPGIIVVIEPRDGEHYKGIGKVIYASQHAGVPVEHLRYKAADGEVLTFDELRARNAVPGA